MSLDVFIVIRGNLLNILITAIFSFTISSSCFSQVSSDHEKWEYVLEDTGDILQIALPAAAGLATIIKKDWQGTKQFTLSYTSSLVITHSLKRIIRKERPENRKLYDAFPSGHTTSAFAGASFIHRHYGIKYGLPAYFLASVVGVSRMEGPDGWHDIWDVSAGAIIGIGCTYLFTKQIEKDHVKIGVSTINDNYYFSFLCKF